MRDVVSQRPFVIFTPQDPAELPAFRERLEAAAFGFKELWACSESDNVADRPVFLADIDNLPFVLEDDTVRAYITADAFRFCTLHYKDEEGHGTMIGALEHESKGFECKDAEYRLREGSRFYVIR